MDRIKRLLNEAPLTVSIVVAALTTATDQSWQGYAAAVGFALLRFVVSPAFPQGDEAISRNLDRIIEQAVVEPEVIVGFDADELPRDYLT